MATTTLAERESARSGSARTPPEHRRDASSPRRPPRDIFSFEPKVPLDYGPLERYLDSADANARERVESELAPGRSYRSINKGDVDEAVRGLGSVHAVVRWHAASVLGDRALGAAAGKAALPKLAAALEDRHPIVRRLAALSIAEWKAAGKPYRAKLEALREDPDATIRKLAEYVLRD